MDAIAHFHMRLDSNVNSPRVFKWFNLQLFFTTAHLYKWRIVWWWITINLLLLTLKRLLAIR